jgi:hypothetical protein
MPDCGFNGLSSFQPLPLRLRHCFDFASMNDFNVWESSINIFAPLAQVNHHLFWGDIDRLKQI